MNIQSVETKDRKSIENAILLSAEKLRASRGVDGYDLNAVETFIEAWMQLSLYFSRHFDRDIGIEVVGEYLEWRFRLQDESLSHSLSDHYREEIEDAVADIVGIMNEIIKTVWRSAHPDE
ncbi:hypothetical protein ANRL4_03369 [Anaerolineae bacterium]|nr:hypothetical protein ANRL4_03369 [Anaerolineae bacterium]